MSNHHPKWHYWILVALLIILFGWSVHNAFGAGMPGNDAIDSQWQFGGGVRGYYLIDSDIPAGWYVETLEILNSQLDVTGYAQRGPWRLQVEPYLQLSTHPVLVGLRAGVGYQYRATTVSLFHHSCHNLDTFSGTVKLSDSFYYHEFNAVDCNMNGVQMRWEYGHTFTNLW